MALPLRAGLPAPERDPLERLWRLDPDVRALVAVAACFGILLFGVEGFLSAAVYALALAPGVMILRAAVRCCPGAAEDGALARSALAGLFSALLILTYEHLVTFCVRLVTAAASRGAESSGIAAAVWLAFAEAFMVAALCEEWVKLRLARRALHFERAGAPTALLLHAASASAAFASLENVFYLNFSAVGADGGVSLATLLTRSVFCVPAHIAWGVSSAAGLAVHHLRSGRGGGGGAATLPWAALGGAMWPSLLLHGLWDYLLFLPTNLATVLVTRCERMDYPADAPAPSPFSTSSDGAVRRWLVWCAAADKQAMGLAMSLGLLRIFFLIGAVVLPAATVYVCHRRVHQLREFEASTGRGGEDASAVLDWAPAPQHEGGSADAEVGVAGLHASAPTRAHDIPAAEVLLPPPPLPPPHVSPPPLMLL